MRCDNCFVAGEVGDFAPQNSAIGYHENRERRRENTINHSGDECSTREGENPSQDDGRGDTLSHGEVALHCPNTSSHNAGLTGNRKHVNLLAVRWKGGERVYLWERRRMLVATVVLGFALPLTFAQHPTVKPAQVKGFADVVKATARKQLQGDISTRDESRSDQRQQGQPHPTGQEGLPQRAKRYLGKRYRYGSSSPSRGFDCSGFVYYLLRTYGILAPRTASELYRLGEPVPKSKLRPGDLVFFRNTARRGDITHVGIYIGDGKFIHASSGRGRVIITSLSDPYYAKRLVGARRLPLRSASGGGDK